MKNTINNSWKTSILVVILAWLSSCQQDVITPANQSIAFVKYYGQVATQTAADLLRTSDGGYILLGATTSYTAGDERDVFVVKTDSLGNEIWSSSFGRAATDNFSTYSNPNLFNGDYVRFDEVGVRLVPLPGGNMYTLACNRTYVRYADPSTTISTRGETKVVLYQIDATTGAATTTDGVELNSNTADTFTEMVSDMKVDATGGVIKYVLTGMTTDVTNKAAIPGNNNQVSDRSDIYTVALDDNFNVLWQVGNQKYGRVGADYGVSVQILPQGYLVCGTIERNYDATATTFLPYSDLLVVFMSKVTGQPANSVYFGNQGTDFRGGQSVYNASTGIVTILGNVSQSSADAGKLALVQINETGMPQSVNGDVITYLDVNGTASSAQPYVSASINEIPDNGGYILAATYKEIPNTEHDICIIKVAPDFSIDTDWPYYYTEAGSQNVLPTLDEAGTVIPVTEAVAGVNQGVLTGYAFTGTLSDGTNGKLGLVKLNP
jgi:hypothetical protein